MKGENRIFASRRWLEWSLVLAGIVVGQAILFGPSLSGRKILLPVDILAEPGIYLPRTPETAGMMAQDMLLSDQIYQFEPARQFAISELSRGRFPLWAPYHYGGVPFVWPKYSLFLLLECCTRSPVILAWSQLLAALVAGAGMYGFCRKSLNVSFWPAAVCAWCYPLTAFFILWQGFPTSLAVYWLPWIFLAVNRTVYAARPLAAIGLSVVTFLVLTSGHLDVAGQVLLGSGLYALWCGWDVHAGQWLGARARTALGLLIAGWGLGFLLAAPHLLPLLEYAQTGSRMEQRGRGAEERPPVGWAAMPQVVLPDVYGTTARGSILIAPGKGNYLPESASAAYAGVLATLLAAPLAWCSRRHRRANIFWAGLAVFGLSWVLNLPGFVHFLRLPVLNMMSHNRLVFLTAFAILALTAIGLENLLRDRVERRWWFWLPAVLLAGLFGWCAYRCLVLPESIANQSQFDAFCQRVWGFVPSASDLEQIQAWFSRHYIVMAEFCALGFIGWLLLWRRATGHRYLFPILALVLVGDLLRFDYGRSAQCDPALYYPPLPALAEAARSVPGRVIGYHCLPASLAASQGLDEIRGYDSIDPARMVELLKTAAQPGYAPVFAVTQYLMPKGTVRPPGIIQLTPVMDMLNVRYVVFRGTPPESVQPAFRSDDYWILINSNALPRVYVPRSVQTMTNAHQTLAALTSLQFSPADVAYVESTVNLPSQCRGTVRIVSETPGRVTVLARMETPGLVVLAGNWDKGWRASWNGGAAPVLRANYTIRGVVVPAGTGTLEFIYRPASVLLGWRLAGGAAAILLGWLIAIGIRKMKARPPGESTR